MRLTSLDHLFWAVGFAGHLTLLCVLWYRRRIRTYPFFTALLILAIVRTIILFAVSLCGTRSQYFYIYWLLTFADMALQIFVVYELTCRVFRPLQTWIPEVRANSSWIIVLSVFVACGLTSMASPPAHSRMQSLATKGNLFSAILMSESFVAMMVLSVVARLPWRTHVARIAQGLGAYSLLSVLIEAAHSCFGVGEEIPAFLLLSHLRMTFYLGCVLYWAIHLWKDEVSAREFPEETLEKLFALRGRVNYQLDVLRSQDKL